MSSLTTITPAATTTEPATAAACFCPCFIHCKRPPALIAAVESCDSGVRFIVVGHFNKTEPSRTTGIAVRHYSRALNRAVWLKPLPQISFGGTEREVSNKYLFHNVP